MIKVDNKIKSKKTRLCTLRQIVVFFICLLSICRVYCQMPTPALVISHLTGDFYVYTTYGLYKNKPVPANSLYMITSKGVVLFDTPWDSTQFQPLLDSIKIKHGKEVVLCISTHFHGDRTAGLEYYKRRGIKTFTTVQTDELSKKNGSKRAEYLMCKDTVFKVGEHSFQTYYGGQGHSPDNIVIWVPDEKILYGGCLVKSTEADDLGYLGDANVKEWSATIINIQQRFVNPTYVIPGHDDWSGNKALIHTLDLVNQYNAGNHN
jgi:metallo-beta-lactamase class B